MIKNERFIFKSYVCSLLLLLISLSVVLSVLSASLLHAEMVSIKGDNVNLRSGPGKNFDILWEYGEGFPVEIIDKKKDWVKIRDFENDTGWVHKSLLLDLPHIIVKANRGKNEKINIRQGPNENEKIVGRAHYGVVFEKIQQRSGWIEVKHESGLSGWVSSVLLWGY